jgi:hypothetical protein
MKYKQIWDVDSAMQILTSSTVDSETWAEAVEWLILYGPEDIKIMLLNASISATNAAFPALKPSHYTEDGQPCYDIADLASSLNISEEEAKHILQQKLDMHQLVDILSTQSANKTVH